MVSDVEPDRQLGQAVGEITDALVQDFDVVDVATQVVTSCAELVGADNVGLLVADAAGQLRLLAATSEEAHVIESFQVEGGDGPCLEAFTTGELVSAGSPGEIAGRWPHFARIAQREGIGAVFAAPLTMRGRPIGSLNVFSEAPGELDADARRKVELLAGLATVALTQAERVRDHATTVQQLQTALTSRVAIEQAKGVLIAATGVDVDEAFARLRAYARANRRRLSEVALDVVERRLDAETFTATAPTGSGRAAR